MERLQREFVYCKEVPALIGAASISRGRYNPRPATTRSGLQSRSAAADNVSTQ